MAVQSLELLPKSREEISPRFPLLIINTAELLSEMGEEEWRFPTAEELHDSQTSLEFKSPDYFKGLIKNWIEFIGLVEEGNRIIRRVRDEGVFEFNIKAFGAWEYTKQVMGGEFEEREEIMASAKRAFEFLLDEGVEMEPGDDDQARKLVRNFFSHLLREPPPVVTPF